MKSVIKSNRGGARLGAGRPKGAERVQLVIKILPETKQALEAMREAQGRTIGQIVDGKFKRKNASRVLCPAEVH